MPVTWKVLGVHSPLWKGTYGCALSVPGGGDGRVGNGITAIWIEDLLSSLPVLAFPLTGKQPEKRQFANSANLFSRGCAGGVRVGKHTVEKEFFTS